MERNPSEADSSLSIPCSLRGMEPEVTYLQEPAPCPSRELDEPGGGLPILLWHSF